MLLELTNVTKYYDSLKAVNNVSLSLDRSKILGIVGRNGAGKTTLIKIIMSIIEADSGNVIKDTSLKIGFLPEERGLYINSCVKEQLLFFAQLNGLSKAQALENIKYYLNRFNIIQYLDIPVKELSKGNKQKIQIISALAHKPDLIILDEPFSGLDPVNAMQLKEVLNECKQVGQSIIFSSHRLEDIEELSDYVYFLKEGEVFINGTVNEIKSKFTIKDEYVLKVNKDISKLLKQKKIEFTYVNNEYSLISQYNVIKDLIHAIVSENILISKFEKKQISLNELFIEELGNE